MRRYNVNAKQYFEEYLPGPKRTVFHTKKGLSWRNAWGVLRYSANNAFLAFVHSMQMKEQVCSSPTAPISHFLLLPPAGSSCRHGETFELLET
jgi:hypothetical protein